MHGSHLLKTWASTQTVVVVNCMCEALVIKEIAKDMGLDFTITLSTDSSAAKGEGLGEGQTSGDQDAVGAGRSMREKS